MKPDCNSGQGMMKLPALEQSANQRRVPAKAGLLSLVSIAALIPRRSAIWTLSCLLALLSGSGLALAASDASVRACPIKQNLPEPIAAKLDSLLASITDSDAESAALLGFAPGAELYVRTPAWIYHRSTGMEDLATSADLNCGGPFQIGSNTKMMTGTVLMQLDEEAVLSVEDLLLKHLPDIAASLPYGDSITLRQLANHTSGVFSYTDNAPNGAAGIMEGVLSDVDLLAKTYAPEDLIRFVIDNGEPSFEPGAEGQWSYSNTGYVLIGMVLEKATGQPLDDLFRQRIFAPLGMDDTFLWNDVPRPEFDLPSSYYETPFDVNMTGWNMSQAWAAGGVISTSHDMSLFLRGLLAGDLFDTPATLAKMLAGVATDGSFEEYGIGIGRKIGGLWGHGGQTLGFESDAGMLREQDISIVVWTNSGKNLAALGTTLVFATLAEAGAMDEPAAMGASLASTRWVWEASIDAFGVTNPVGAPDRYALQFLEGGDLALDADCNRVLGSYSAQDDTISLDLGPSTMALCPPESLDRRFLQELQGMTSFQREGGALVLSAGRDGPSMRFTRQGE